MHVCILNTYIQYTNTTVSHFHFNLSKNEMTSNKIMVVKMIICT